MPESFPGKEMPTIEEISVDEKEINRLATDLFEKKREAILTHKENYVLRYSIPTH